jgi:hypothetical protein
VFVFQGAEAAFDGEIFSPAVPNPSNFSRTIAFCYDFPTFLPLISIWEAPMANREQRSNREKKKPKADKPDKHKTAPPPFVAPELIRKPHKGKPPS